MGELAEENKHLESYHKNTKKGVCVYYWRIEEIV